MTRRVAGISTLLASLNLAVASTLTPPVLPLIVRNPYLSTWLGNARGEPWSQWPMFYTGQSVGFSVLATAPETSTVYPLLGRAHDALDSSSKHYNVSHPLYLGAQYDASTTNLSYSIPSPNNTYGSPAELTLSFLSPITPTSTLRQAIPASYLTVHVKANFDVSVYIDVNGQWVSGDRNADIVWQFDGADADSKDKQNLKTFKVKRKHELLFTEHRDRAEWGELHFTGPSDATHECGTSADLRQHFAKTSILKNKVDSNYRAIMDAEPVFAFSKTFNLSSSSNSSSSSPKSDSVLFTIAHLQDPVTQFASARGLTFMRPLWKSYFPTDSSSLIFFHYHDHSHALALASNYSSQLIYDAYASGSSNYADIVSSPPGRSWALHPSPAHQKTL